MSRRIMTTENLEEDVKIESHLRPQLLEDYIGQAKAKETAEDLYRSGKAGARHWIMSCSMDLRDLERRRLPGSLPMRWV